MQDTEENKVTDTTPPASTPTAPKSSNNKLLIAFAAVIGLMLVLIGLLAFMLLSKSTPDKTSNSSQQDSSKTNQATKQEREELMRVPTSNDKLEYVIYKPEQNGANTTIHFAVENICSGCSDKTYTGVVTTSYSKASSSFLVDDNNGKKYSLITDEDGEELASPTCAAAIKFGEKSECFVSFTKVPSGSTVSWVFGSVRIDKIAIN
jgi:hypothetical protein